MSFSGNDRLPYHIRDGVRYLADQNHKTKILDGIKEKKRTSPSDPEVPKKRGKKLKEFYLVNPKKFAATASEEELAHDLSEDDLGTDDVHRIIQCKIRYVI
jgi:hypothetical protein